MAGGSLGGCGRGAPELGQGQAAAFCSLAKPPLTQRRGTRLRGGSKRGSIGLTAMETGTRVCVEFAAIAASATDHRDPSRRTLWARAGEQVGGRRARKCTRRRAFRTLRTRPLGRCSSTPSV